MKSYKIAVIPGDGIGPEVVREGLKVLEAVQKRFGFKVETADFDFGGERYLRTGETLPDNAVEELKGFDAIYLGGIGHPDVKPGILERGILLKLRFDLDQYINLRPVKLYENVATPLKDRCPEDIDYLVVRENTAGLYKGIGEFQQKDTEDEVAVQQMVYSYHEVDRCVRYAFEQTLQRHKKTPWAGLNDDERSRGCVGKVTLCGKTNVLTYVFDLWQRVFDQVAKEYPTVITDYVHVDASCIFIVESPQRFDTIVTCNMFGDIITDLAAVTQGGMGVAPSGNINPDGVSMFEPVHGTAPQFAGQGVINPVAAIATLVMMLEYLGEQEAAVAVEASLRKTILKMNSMLVGKMGMTTSEVGDLVTAGI
ncbi:MAG: 3-isopropylmalate dehydrogenase [Candidatus Omnitrophota bacterium]